MDLQPCFENLGFTSSPFSLTPDTDYFYKGHQYQEALTTLRYGLMTGSFTVLTGEVGLGKTTLCRYLLRFSKVNKVKTAYIFNPMFTLPDMMASIYFDLVGEKLKANSVADMDRVLGRVLVEISKTGKRVVVVVDEAHRLSPDLLEGLRILSNLESEKRKLITFILVGQPELRETLNSRKLRSLRQRIAVSYIIRPLSYSQTRDYIRHRMKVDSVNPDLLVSDAAIAAIYLFSGGVPRLINLISERALLCTFLREERVISWRSAWRSALEVKRAL